MTPITARNGFVPLNDVRAAAAGSVEFSFVRGRRVVGQNTNAAQQAAIPAFVVSDLDGHERDVFPFTVDPFAAYGVAVSPNGRFVASRSPAPGEFAGGGYRPADSQVLVHSVDTGEARRLLTAPFPQAFAGVLQWLPDSSAVIAGRFKEPGVRQLELWVVPLDGGAPRKFETSVQNLLPSSKLSPDGRRIALMVGEQRNREVQILEGVLPGTRTR